MAVVNGQLANQNTFNNAFMSRTAATTSTVAKAAFQNSDPESGANITNIQRAVNKAFEGVGTTGEADTLINEYNSTNYISNGDNRKIAVEKLDTQLKDTQDELDIATLNIADHETRIATIESADSSFSGDKTFTQDVTVQGNLTVEGTTTSINSVNLEVEDKNITVNKGGSDITADGAGIDVDRDTDNGAIRFDSTLDSKWKIGVLSALYEVIVSGIAQTIDGVKDFIAGIKTDTISESTLDAGVTVDGVLIKDGAINKSVVGLSNVTNDSQLKRAAGDFDSFTEKVTPVDDDIVLIEDSEDGYAKKKAKLSELLGGGAISFQETLSGTANGINTTFGPMTYAPSDDNSILVMIDFVAVPLSGYTVSGSSIVFEPAWIPQAGQSIYVYYGTQGVPAVPVITGIFKVEKLIVTAGDIAAKEIQLSATPASPNEVLLFMKGAAVPPWIGDDFSVSSDILSWDGLGLEPFILEGDELLAVYVT